MMLGDVYLKQECSLPCISYNKMLVSLNKKGFMADK